MQDEATTKERTGLLDSLAAGAGTLGRLLGGLVRVFGDATAALRSLNNLQPRHGLEGCQSLLTGGDATDESSTRFALQGVK